MQTGTKEIGVILTLVLLAGLVVVVSVCTEPTLPGSRRRCGCADNRFNSADGFLSWLKGTTHCCNGGRLLADFKTLQLAQKMHQEDTGRVAASQDELLPYLGGVVRTNYFTIVYTPGTNGWSASASKTPSLPGNYLMTADGKVYFDERHTATTNDLCIATLKLQ